MMMPEQPTVGTPPPTPAPAPGTHPGRYVLTLPSGYHVVMRKRGTFRVRDRDQVLLNAGIKPGDEIGENAAARGIAMMGALAAVAIEDWDVPDVDEYGTYIAGTVLPLPRVKPDVRDEMLPIDWMPIERELGGLMAALFPDFGPAPDEGSPTPPSAD